MVESLAAEGLPDLPCGGQRHRFVRLEHACKYLAAPKAEGRLAGYVLTNGDGSERSAIT